MAINTPTRLYQTLKGKRKLINAIYGGTQSMRDAEVNYLPKEPGETQKAYDARLKRSYLKNGVKSAVLGTRGKVFSKEVTVDNWNGRVPLENVDMMNTNLTIFSADLFTKAVRDGMAFVLVDAPSLENAESAADVEAQNIRPHFTVVEMDNVIGWAVETINNVPMLSDVRITEGYTEINEDFVETDYEQVRRMRIAWGGEQSDMLGYLTDIHRKVKGESDDTWAVIASVWLPIPTIPLLPCYTNQTGFFEAEPFFSDLAWINLQHWQSSSDQNNILHVSRVPRFFAYGFEKETLDTITDHGAASLITTSKLPDEVEAGWIEASGDSIKQGTEDLDSLEESMDALALEPLVSKATADITATRTKTNEAKSNSVIQFWARSLGDTLDDSFTVANYFSGTTESSHVTKVNDDYKIIDESHAVAKEIREWYGTRSISHITMLEMGKEADFLPKHLVPEEELIRIQQETPVL